MRPGFCFREQKMVKYKIAQREAALARVGLDPTLNRMFEKVMKAKTLAKFYQSLMIRYGKRSRVKRLR